MTDSSLRAKGREIRSQLVGSEFARKLDAEVYTDRHMEKFAEITQEHIFGTLWARPGLDLKTKCMITIVSDVATGATEALGLHIRFGLNHGWTEDDISDAIIHLTGYVGVPLTRKALVVAREVFEAYRMEQARV